jgi:hypothetical protein
MKTKLFILTSICFLFFSCEKISYFGNNLGGTQSPIGEVDNGFSFTTFDGVTNTSATVTDLTKGISTISYSVTVTDPKLAVLAGYINGANVSGSTISGSIKAKFTSEGIQTIHDDGDFILIKYNAKVGDKYTLEGKDYTVTREVTNVSETDDYFWSWMLIKTITVVETGHTAPGITKIEYVFNHKFGLVGTKMYLSDGSTKSAAVYSDATN